MKMSVTQLRVLVLTLNLLLAAGVPAFAYYGYKRGWDLKETARIEDLNKFLPGREAGTMPNSAGRVAIVATWLQPKPPPAIGDPSPKETDGTPGAEAAAAPRSPDGLEAGPLGEQGWEYHFYLLRADPLRNYVILKKKDAANPMSPPGVSRARSTIRPPVRARTGRPLGNIKVQSPSDQISFHIKQREFKNEELGLHFMIHSADRNQFVYWIPAEPKRHYALPFTHESQYDKNPSDGLRPPEKTPEEKAFEEQEGEKKNPFIYRTPDWESQIEKDYQDALDGKINLMGGGSSKAEAPLPGIGRPLGAPSKAAGVPGTPRAPTIEEKQKLNEAIRAIPKDKQKELLDGLKKAGQNNLR
ncbi:MAG TPA: hypothetical protein VMT52_03835 [Planctomycetota bacterium]|nr:hypothetical protein [Planctomycetota bacterium]